MYLAKKDLMALAVSSIVDIGCSSFAVSLATFYVRKASARCCLFEVLLMQDCCHLIKAYIDWVGAA